MAGMRQQTYSTEVRNCRPIACNKQKKQATVHTAMLFLGCNTSCVHTHRHTNNHVHAHAHTCSCFFTQW